MKINCFHSTSKKVFKTLKIIWLKAAKYTGLNDNKLSDLKLILPRDYSKHLKLPEEVEKEGKGKEDQERQKPAQIALELAEEKCKKLFLDQFGTPYIAIKINDHIETSAVKIVQISKLA